MRFLRKLFTTKLTSSPPSFAPMLIVLFGILPATAHLCAGEIDDLLVKASKHIDTKSYQDVILCYEQVIRLDPKHIIAHHGKGVMLANLGRHSEAIKSFDRALEIDQDFISAHRDRATSLQILLRFQEAADSLQRAKAIESKWREEALLAYQSRDYERASLRCSQLICQKRGQKRGQTLNIHFQACRCHAEWLF